MRPVRLTMTEERLSLKDMCARFNVTPRTLRYYEYIELLRPERVGRQRFYGPREIARMKLIQRGKRFGFTLEEIRQWLEIYNTKGTVAQYRVFVEYAERQLHELKRQRDLLDSTIADLSALHQQTLRLLEEGLVEEAKGKKEPSQPSPPRGRKP